MLKRARVRIVYVGRQARLCEELAALFYAEKAGSELAAADGLPPIDLRFVTNQKAAMQLVRDDSPHVLLLETDGKLESRVRFSSAVKIRLPAAAIVAVGQVPPGPDAPFHSVITLPLVREQARAALLDALDQHGEYVMNRGPLHLNLATRTVVTPSGRYRMTPKQCALLEMLLRRHGETVKRSDIMQQIWETSYMEDTRTLDVHVRWLRERIEPDPSAPTYLVTVRGVGYKLNLDR